MSKEKKAKVSDADKPLEERNYWKLTKSEKSLWLSKKGLTKGNDIIIPIAMPFIGVAIMILAVVLLVLTMKATGGVFATNKPIMLAASGVVAAIGLGVIIWRIIAMKKEKKGFFINQYYAGNKSGVERMHKEIEEESAASEPVSDDLSSELDL